MTAIEGLDKRVVIKDSRIGIADPDSKFSKVTYFLDLGNNRLLIGLLNQNNEVIQMPRNSIQALSYTFPRYTTLTIPLQHIIQGVKSSVFTTSEVYDTHYLSFLPINFDFDRGGQVRIDFSTAEILTRRIVNDEHLLILYGMLGAEGEIQLSSDLMFYEFKSLGVKQQAIFNQNERYSIVYSFSFANVPQFLTFKCGIQKYRLIVLDMYSAGRVWFHRIDNHDVLVLGPDFLGSESSHELTLEFSKDMTIYTFSDWPLYLISRSAVLRASRAFEPESRLSIFKYRHQKTNKFVHPSLLHGQILLDSSILGLKYDFLANGFKPLNAINPTPLEMNQIYYGNAFYTAQFDLDSSEYQAYYEDVTAKRLPKIGGLYVEHASDIVGVYVNGHYVTTVVPIGTEIDSNGSSDYQFVIPPEFLKIGSNRILFRVEVWGHGSFMWHRGNIGKIFKLNIPALGVDSVKGLHGKATFAKKTLKNWMVRQWSDGQLMQAWGLGTEAQGGKQMQWKNGKLPLELRKGGMIWYKVTVQKKEIFPDENEVKNVVIYLKGENAKATIYVNGRIIGRWLSDNQCLTRGSWIQPLRNIWTEAPADEIPLQPEWFKQKDNVIAFYFEDMGNQAIQYQSKNAEKDKVQARHKVASGVIERLEVIVKQDRAVRKVKASIRLEEN
ncbi:hypothetical protein BKA69DRAFT_625888 [Paraphysoderma sedebokerense]|nr:hypothetical protein BKA69DRAFT_625888 [Paraphysoderma sedebokerense]